MNDQKDIDMKDKLKEELNGEITRKNSINFSTKESKKSDHNNEECKNSFPSSSLSSSKAHQREKQEISQNSQKFNQNNREMKFWFLDCMASFLIFNARTVDGVSTDSTNSINYSSIQNMDIRKCRELDVNKIKLDGDKCEIVRAFIVEMEIAAIITPSYRNRKFKNDKNGQEVSRKTINKCEHGDESCVADGDNSCSNGFYNSRNDQHGTDNDDIDNNDYENDNNIDNNNNNNDNDNDYDKEIQNRNLTSDFIKSIQSLTVTFKALLPGSDVQQSICQNVLNSHSNKQDKYDIKINQNKSFHIRPDNNFNIGYKRCTDTNKKSILCTEKKQEKLYHILCVILCAVLDSFIFSFQTTISKKSISEIVEVIFLLFITNPDIKSTLVQISNLFHYSNNKIHNQSRNLWSRICCVHRYSDAIPELIYRIISNSHFSLLHSISTSTLNKKNSSKIEHKNGHENEHETANQNNSENQNNDGRIRIVKKNELSFIPSIENIRTNRKRKYNPIPSLLLTPDNSPRTTPPLSTSLIHSNTSSSHEISFLSSLPQIRKITQNGVLAVDEKRIHRNTEFKKTEFVETENDLTNPLLWEEFSDLLEEKNRSEEVEEGKGKEEGKRKDKEEEKKGRVDVRRKEEGKGAKGMRIDSGRTEHNTSKNKNSDPSGKRMKTEINENSERANRKDNLTSKTLKEKIEVSGKKKGEGPVVRTRMRLDGCGNSVQNSDKNNGNNVQNNDNNAYDGNNDYNDRSDDTESRHNSNNKVTDNNRSFNCSQTPTDTTKNKVIHTYSIHNTTKSSPDPGSHSRQFMTSKKKIEPFHNLPISNTNTNTKASMKIGEVDVIKKDASQERMTANPSAPPPPIPENIPTNIPKNIPKNVPENVLQNTEAGWNKKDISKKWSMSF